MTSSAFVARSSGPIPCGCGGQLYEHRPSGCSCKGFAGDVDVNAPLCRCPRYAEPADGVPMNQVTSSNVDAIGYEGDVRRLIVRFKGGGVYAYRNVPKAVYDSMLSTARIGGSVGSFLARHVKPAYGFEKLSSE